MGRAENTASMRMKGQIRGAIHPINCASVKVIIALWAEVADLGLQAWVASSEWQALFSLKR
jgi:hypothetical protein